MYSSILSIKDYGKIDIKLKEVMDNRGITRNKLAKLANTRFEVIDKWYKNDLEKVDTDILARLCFILNCNVGDIIVFTPNSEH